MRTLAAKQPINDFAKQNKQGDRGRSRSISPLSTGMPLLQRQCACGGSCPRCKEELGIQTKLKISEPGDKYEQEADRIADEVMRMPESTIQQQVGSDEQEMVQKKAVPNHTSLNSKSASSDIPPVVQEVLRYSGQPLDPGTLAFMESRFGHNFSQVRAYTNAEAARSAQLVKAKAYTLGSNIVFGAGQYEPNTSAGRRLLAHELVHTLQQSNGVNKLQRISFDSCTSSQETTVRTAHTRAVDMLNNAITKLGIYTGTTPPDVRTALDTHFHATSSAFGSWVRFNLQYLTLFVNQPQYECHSTQSIPNPAWTMWCVPFTDIELYPNWFSSYSLDSQARILIHEWVHHYGCNFDLGYKSDPGYPGHSTTRSLFNADPWAWFVYDVR